MFVENGLGKNALALVGAPAKCGRCGTSEANEAMKPKGGTPDIATRRHGIAVSKHGNDRPKGNALYPAMSAMRKPQERRDK